MDKFAKLNIAGTPLYPNPQHIIHKRVPVVLPLKKSLYGPSIAISISSKPPKGDAVQKEIVNSKPQVKEKLPIIRLNNKKLNKSVRYGKYSKWIPKFYTIKPLFHDRNRSYNLSPENDDEEYTDLKNKISWIDY